MVAPNTDSSTREERLDYVLNEWRCLHNCEPMEQREQKPNLFGLCRIATEEDDSQYGILSVPTLMLFRNGEVLWRTSGVVQKSELLATIDPFLK